MNSLQQPKTTQEAGEEFIGQLLRHFHADAPDVRALADWGIPEAVPTTRQEERQHER